MIVTFFDDEWGFKRREIETKWDDLADWLRDPDVFPSKKGCPMLKLGRFGDEPSERGSLRHDANLLAVCGVEGDHDAGKMTPAEASQRLKAAGIRHLVYTSASHTPELPRWRVLCPLPNEVTRDERLALVEMLNGVLDGALTRESFAASQAFYVGRVGGVDYEVFE